MVLDFTDFELGLDMILLYNSFINTIDNVKLFGRL